MSKIAGIFFCLILFVSVILAGSAGAADDDTQASVYLVFDPETGEFVTVDDPDAAAQHKARQDQEEIESVADTAAGAVASTTGDASEARTWIIGAVLIAIVLGGVWLQRKRQRTT